MSELPLNWVPTAFIKDVSILQSGYRLSVCSLPEQQEIVRLLDEQFTVIEQNEREVLKRSDGSDRSGKSGGSIRLAGSGGSVKKKKK